MIQMSIKKVKKIYKKNRIFLIVHIKMIQIVKNMTIVLKIFIWTKIKPLKKL
jgi:hypothetical protein